MTKVMATISSQDAPRVAAGLLAQAEAEKPESSMPRASDTRWSAWILEY
jgi:hypothetical protein